VNSATLAAGVLFGLLAAGCVAVQHAPPPEPPAPAVQTVPIAVAPPAVAAPQTAPSVVAAPVPASPVEPIRPAAPTALPRPPSPQVATRTRPAAQAAQAVPAKPPAAVTSAKAATPPVPKAAAAPVAPKPAAPPLDLTSLETRLRETKAIGVFTKISLKNQVDDLLVKFRAYHKRQAALSLAELRQSYDMLLLKVLSLLQDSDPSLARDIVASRAAIWSILADPEKFSSANLMAGEMR
jgi:hypothetical protein